MSTSNVPSVKHRYWVQSEQCRGERRVYYVCDREKEDQGPSSRVSGVVYWSQSRKRAEDKCDKLNGVTS